VVALIALFVVWLALLVMWVAAIVSVTRHSAEAFSAAGRSLGPTIALVVVTGWLGAAYYWLVIRRELEPNRTVPRALPNV
jgi:hypothetical protein